MHGKRKQTAAAGTAGTRSWQALAAAPLWEAQMHGKRKQTAAAGTAGTSSWQALAVAPL